MPDGPRPDNPRPDNPRPDPAAEYGALRTAAGAVWLERDFVAASGPDTVRFLQGQLSQDVAGLDTGASTWSLLLSPQGKVVAFVRVLRRADDDFVVETDAGYGAAVVERLERFKLRTKCHLEALPWKCLAVRGPGAHEAVAQARAGTLVTADWPGLPGRDLIGEDPAAPENVALCSAEAYEVVRIEAGIPRMGAELDERTIPAEAGIVDRSVSFNKGCYTGQELVARIDSRGGHVPRHLRGVVVDGGAVPPPGASVSAGGREVGRLTSVAWSPGMGGAVALAFIGRAVEAPAPVELAWDGGSAAAAVRVLPLVG